MGRLTFLQRQVLFAMSFQLTFSDKLTSDVDLSSLPWNRVWDLSAGELEEVPIRIGRSSQRLSNVYKIEQIADNLSRLTINNCTSRVHGIAVGLKAGEVIVNGDAGHRLAVDMTGGFLKIIGNVGNDLGGASPGNNSGMRGGEIHVSGNAGNSVGARLRRGLIAIAGNVGDDCGVDAIAGTIIVLGDVGTRAGIGMKRASLILGKARTIDASRYDVAMKAMPTWLRVYFRSLGSKGFVIPGSWMNGPYQRFTGDHTGLSKAEIWALCD
jgi:formylmethanofuran dehydrogenase subunit C